MLLHDRLGGPLTGLLYVTARLARSGPAPALTSDEGALHWIDPERFSDLDIIETTAAALPLLVADTARDPDGWERMRMGLASFRGDDLVAPQWRDGSEPSEPCDAPG
jgi:hypothetical protein